MASKPWHSGEVETPVGAVPRVATRLRWQDQLGALRVRSAIGRMTYGVEPRLYAVGIPTPESPVLVTANYKLTFDRLRQELDGLDAWILVLDTDFINVWCAAGKGTFGTKELVERIAATRLAAVVSHRTLIVPQLGAPGISAHKVRQRSGFKVVYGPVRACDIKAFLAAGMTATPEMRRVRFGLMDRLAVIPVEIAHWAGYAIGLAAVMALVSVALSGGGGPEVYHRALFSAVLVLAAFVAGGVVSPILLPVLPGRAFSLKGAWVGVALTVACCLGGWLPRVGSTTTMSVVPWGLLLPAISAFMAMNYTGTSTYTSQSGVKREMRVALPLQLIAFILGLGLWVVAHFV